MTSDVTELDPGEDVAHRSVEGVHVHGPLLVAHHEDLGVVLVAEHLSVVAECLGRLHPLPRALVNAALGQGPGLLYLGVDHPPSLVWQGKSSSISRTYPPRDFQSSSS